MSETKNNVIKKLKINNNSIKIYVELQRLKVKYNRSANLFS